MMTYKFLTACFIGVGLMIGTATAQTISDQPNSVFANHASTNSYMISDSVQPQAAESPQPVAAAPTVNNYLVNPPSCDGCGDAGCDGGGCGGGCDSGAGCGSCGTGCGGCQQRGIGNGLVFGNIIKRSDHCFSDFISPMTNPVFFEDPRALTEARLIYLHHKVPTAAGGGAVQLYALQLRARVSENVSIIATKDGYITATNPLIDDGWADLSAGLKVNLMQDNCRGRLLSAGLMYEFANGSQRALQGNGDGNFNLFASGGSRIGQYGHWLTSAGWRIPTDDNLESTSLYWSNHFDVQVTQRWYALTEFNWYHWTQSGAGGIAGVEGLDLFNLGSTDVTGNDILTGAVGTKFKKDCHSEIGIAWEFPLTQRRDILENRFTFDWIVRY